jgi:hypothetical protein
MKINRNCKGIDTLDPFINKERANALETSNIQEFLSRNSYSKAAQKVIYIAYRNLFGLEPSELNTLFTMLFTKSAGGSVESLVDSYENCAQEKKIKGTLASLENY